MLPREGRDLKARPQHTDIVGGTRPEHDLMLGKRDRFGITVSGEVLDFFEYGHGGKWFCEKMKWHWAWTGIPYG
jgi:hypothetical protein